MKSFANPKAEDRVRSPWRKYFDVLHIESTDFVFFECPGRSKTRMFTIHFLEAALIAVLNRAKLVVLTNGLYSLSLGQYREDMFVVPGNPSQPIRTVVTMDFS